MRPRTTITADDRQGFRRIGCDVPLAAHTYTAREPSRVALQFVTGVQPLAGIQITPTARSAE